MFQTTNVANNVMNNTTKMPEVVAGKLHLLDFRYSVAMRSTVPDQQLSIAFSNQEARSITIINN